MGKITILPETTIDPISLIGRRAGCCWGADTTNKEKNYKRGIDCIKSNHGRTLEFPEVHLLIEGYSARVIREYYTHIGCLPSRLQASTRYINYSDFDYVTPGRIEANDEALKVYDSCMNYIADSLTKLEELGIPREDSALFLPLGMTTTIVDKRNARNLIDMSRHRECSRANWEFREMFSGIKKALSEYSDEWKTLIEMEFKPMCEFLGYCPEKHSCGRINKRNKEEK